MSDEKIEKIQREFKQLFQRKVELSKFYQQQLSCIVGFCQMIVHLLLHHDPELESVNSTLKEDKCRLYDILQVAASVPPSIPGKRLDQIFFLFSYPQVMEFRLPCRPNGLLCDYFD